jgi:hypothetical protein
MGRHRARTLLVVGVLVVGVLVGVGVWLWRRAGSSTPVTEASAVKSFRERAGAGGPAGAGIPRPGVYSYRAAGSERGGAGPFSIGRRIPATARYIVSRSPGGYEAELALSDEHIEAARYRVTPSGQRETWRRTKVTFLAVGSDDRRTLRPAPLRLPTPLRPGRVWRARYRAGTLPVSIVGRVLRPARVELDGRSVPTVVVAIHTDTGGVHPGTRDERLWWSQALGLPVRWEIRMDIGGSVIFRSTAALALDSPAPRT